MIKIHNLSYQADNKVLFQNLNFSVDEGDSLLLTGPSGSGKSTILKIIARLVAIQQGEIFLDQQNISDLPIENYRQKVSYAAQSVQLFGETVRDNLDLPFLVRNLPIDEQQEISGLEKMELPAEYLDKSINDISGGERQRVGVLRNLLFPPQVLLLDEISTGLDSDTKSKIWQVIDQLQEENHFSLISVSHDPEEISQAKRKIQIGGSNE
ncbi:ABC transporter ATP-binding protein [Xylocopilactobacillus apis]|uniref:ABC transporter ATP-binding protein n=1 Tax=Xylocopilactobacillus apis TaxID=2932183 RepID=A0AAU9D0Y4_9LACO|nr:ATP-binding cassette domain-containing protein [Xylocopilactobacillus apis]BDR56141.1 ABC transporter ATP-binding protein [Xylocopilactobacillus apis]